MIYRYFDFNNCYTSRIFTHNEIYLCNAGQWKSADEYFLKIGLTKEELYNSTLNYVMELYRKNKTEYLDWIIDTSNYMQIELPSNQLLIDQYVESLCLSFAEKVFKNQNSYEDFLRSNLFERTGMCSFSKSPFIKKLWEWKINGINNNIMCIGIDESNIHNIANKDFSNMEIKEICYNDTLPQYNPFGKFKMLEDMLNVCFTLPRNYEHEKEIRIHKLLTDNAKESKERFIYYDKINLKEIFVWHKCDQAVLLEIKKYAPNIEIKFITAENYFHG